MPTFFPRAGRLAWRSDRMRTFVLALSRAGRGVTFRLVANRASWFAAGIVLGLAIYMTAGRLNTIIDEASPSVPTSSGSPYAGLSGDARA